MGLSGWKGVLRQSAGGERATVDPLIHAVAEYECCWRLELQHNGYRTYSHWDSWATVRQRYGVWSLGTSTVLMGQQQQIRLALWIGWPWLPLTRLRLYWGWRKLNRLVRAGEEVWVGLDGAYK